KHLVFFEDEICNNRLVRSRSEIKRPQLLIAPHQKRKLRLERRSSLAVVKRAQKRIRLRLHHTLRIQPLGENSRQRALADSNGTFYRNVTRKLKEIGHGLGLVLRNGRISRMRPTDNCAIS